MAHFLWDCFVFVSPSPLGRFDMSQWRKWEKDKVKHFFSVAIHRKTFLGFEVVAVFLSVLFFFFLLPLEATFDGSSLKTEEGSFPNFHFEGLHSLSLSLFLGNSSIFVCVIAKKSLFLDWSLTKAPRGQPKMLFYPEDTKHEKLVLQLRRKETTK